MDKFGLLLAADLRIFPNFFLVTITSKVYSNESDKYLDFTIIKFRKTYISFVLYRCI